MVENGDIEIIQKRKKKKFPKWTTTTIAASIGRKELLAATFQEIILHLISLIFLTIHIFSRANASEYYLTVTLKNAFEVEEGLGEVVTAEKFWKYLKENVVEVFYDSDGDDDHSQHFLQSYGNLDNHGSSFSENSLVILNENLVLGVPRLRQVKVTNSSCAIHGYFRRLFVDCYNKFGYFSEDKETFGLGTPTAWTFSDASITKSLRYWGTLTSYSGGGFYVDFLNDINDTTKMLQDLKDNLWITRGTRAVFLDFSLYNANLNLFCICKCEHAIAFLTWIHRHSEEPSTTSIKCYWKKPVLSAVGTSLKFVKARDMGKAKMYGVPTSDGTFLAAVVDHSLELGRVESVLVEYYKTFSDMEGLSLNHLVMLASADMCHRAERETISQRSCPLWFELRFARITASKAYDVIHCQTLEGALVESLLGARKFHSPAMLRGRNSEEVVLGEVEKQTGRKLARCGLLIHPDCVIFGASPDAVCEAFVVEIKCPAFGKAMTRLIFEFLPSGGITPNFRLTPATLAPFPGIWEWILRILLYFFCLYVLYCLCEEIREMIYFKGRYFLLFWNYIDVIVIFLTLLVVVGTEYMGAVMESYIKDIQDHSNLYGNLETPRVIYEVVKISEATLLFFVYLRTFKYLNFNRRMAQLNNTIRNCSKDILGFSVMFFVAYFAYAELGYLVFGSEVDDFRSFGQSMFTLLRTILGDFDYQKIHNANWIVAPIYFLSYIILVFFVLLNMFLAIINDTYADVKTDIAIAPKEMEMSEYVANLFKNLFRKLGCKIKEKPEAQRLIQTNISQIRDALKKCNFEDREIEMYFTKYDIDPLKDLKKQDVEKFFEMFAQEDLARTKGHENIVSWKDFQRQDDKLAELENSLVMLGQRVHELLRSIENMQKTPQKTLQL